MKFFNALSGSPFSWYGFTYTYVVTDLFLRLVLFPIVEWIYAENWISIVLSVGVFLFGLTVFTFFQMQLARATIRVMSFESAHVKDETNG